MVESPENPEEQVQSIEKLKKDEKHYATAGTIAATASIGLTILTSMAFPVIGTAAGVAATGVAWWFLKEKLDKEREISLETKNSPASVAGRPSVEVTPAKPSKTDDDSSSSSGTA
jgi:hypothetical protein